MQSPKFYCTDLAEGHRELSQLQNLVCVNPAIGKCLRRSGRPANTIVAMLDGD